MKFSRRRALRLVVVPALLLPLAACSAKAPAPVETLAPRWRQMIEQVLKDPQTTDLQRQILSDYVITDAEYNELKTQFNQCMNDHGWVLDGGWSGAPGSGNEQKGAAEDILSCEDATTGWVEPIYYGIKDNPSGLTTTQLIRDCFTAHDVPDGADLSDDAFEEMIWAPDYRPSTPEGMLCVKDPDGSQGLTVAAAEAMYDSSPNVAATPR
jgi:hypothetical protein